MSTFPPSAPTRPQHIFNTLLVKAPILMLALAGLSVILGILGYLQCGIYECHTTLGNVTGFLYALSYIPVLLLVLLTRLHLYSAVAFLQEHFFVGQLPGQFIYCFVIVTLWTRVRSMGGTRNADTRQVTYGPSVLDRERSAEKDSRPRSG